MIEVVADSETFPIARGQLAPRIVCYQSAVNDADPTLHRWCDAPIEEHLRNADVIVGANFAFDAGCFISNRPDLIPLVIEAYDAGRIVDVQLDAKLLDIAAGRYDHAEIAGWSLEALAARLGRVKNSNDEWRTRFCALDGLPPEAYPEAALKYALGDITETREVRRAQLPAAQKWRDHGVEVLGAHSIQAAQAAFGLHLASCWGVLTDPARTRLLAERIERYLGGVRERLQQTGLVRENGKRDTKAAARRMIASCLAQDPPRAIPLTKGGQDDVEAAAREFEGGIAANLAPEVAAHRAYVSILPKGKAAKLDRAFGAGVLPLKKGVVVTYADLLAEDFASTPQGVLPLDGVQLNKDCCTLAHDEDLYLYAEYAGANLVRGRCERMAQGFELPLQTRFDPLKETSRTSSTQPSDPLVGEQMQNFPRSNALTKAEQLIERDKSQPLLIGLRETFRPRDGNTFIGADYSMAELHTVAQLCIKLFGFSRLAELLNARTDVHLWLAAQTLGITYEQAAANPALYDTDRQRCKPGNFGFWGGMGPDKFILYSRAQFNIVFTRAEAQRFKAQWRAAFPETAPYFENIKRMLGDHKSFTYVHPITGFVRGRCGYSDGANHGFQHLAAYGAKAAIWEVTKACFTPGSALFGWRIWNFVHDEILLEGPLHGARDAAMLLQSIMERCFNRYVPDVPTHAEPFITPIWSKKVKTIRNEKGELNAWEPKLPPELLCAA